MNSPSLTAQGIGMQKISPSQLDSYEACPLLFYYQSWLGLKLKEDKLHMDFGNAIHGALETLYVQYDNHFGGAWSGASFQRVEDSFLDKWRPSHVPQFSFDAFLETKAGRESGFKTAKDLYDSMKEDGIIMLKSYWKEKERMLVEYRHDLVDFEEYARVELINPDNKNEKLPIPLSMRIDARNRNRDKIVDFKTSKGKYDETESRKKIQGQCYLFAELMQTGKMIYDFDYIVLRKGLKSEDRIQVVELHYDEADMIAFYYRVQAILARISQREFVRPSQGHASFCDCWEFENALSINNN